MTRNNKLALTATGRGTPNAVDRSDKLVSITPICPGTTVSVETDVDTMKINSAVPGATAYPTARYAQYNASARSKRKPTRAAGRAVPTRARDKNHPRRRARVGRRTNFAARIFRPADS